MLYDIWTVTRKDLKEIFIQRGSLRAGIVNVLIILAIAGVLFPLQSGPEWITGPLGLLTSAWLPVFMSMGLVADAFAGERERHTLETLLASRLSDQAILFGKMLAAVLYGMGIAVGGFLLGALTVNLTNPGTGFYPAVNFASALGLSLLAILLVTGVGVQVSLRASNVRQAYQRMSLGFLVLWMPLLFGPYVLPEEWKLGLAQWIAQINGLQAVLITGGLLLVIDVVLVLLARGSFQRTQMVFD